MGQAQTTPQHPESTVSLQKLSQCGFPSCAGPELGRRMDGWAPGHTERATLCNMPQFEGVSRLQSTNAGLTLEARLFHSTAGQDAAPGHACTGYRGCRAHPTAFAIADVPETSGEPATGFSRLPFLSHSNHSYPAADVLSFFSSETLTISVGPSGCH